MEPTQQYHPRPSRRQIIEAVYAGVATALPGTDVKTVCALGEPLIDILVSIAEQRSEDALIMDNYEEFCVTNAILDEIEKLVPALEGELKVEAIVTRAQRKQFFKIAGAL